MIRKVVLFVVFLISCFAVTNTFAAKKTLRNKSLFNRYANEILGGHPLPPHVAKKLSSKDFFLKARKISSYVVVSDRLKLPSTIDNIGVKRPPMRVMKREESFTGKAPIHLLRPSMLQPRATRVQVLFKKVVTGHHLDKTDDTVDLVSGCANDFPAIKSLLHRNLLYKLSVQRI